MSSPGPTGEIRKKALDLLARREHARAELERKLLARGFPRDDVEVELDALVEQGLLSESRFAEAYVRSRAGRGFGPNRIHQELRERGISDSLVAAHLDASSDDWMERLAQVRRKRFGDTAPVAPAARAKEIRFLQYRGFSVEQIRRVLAELG